MKTPLTFSKIVATPTLSSWSQAYNAGNLAAVISLVRKPLENPESSEDQTLSLQALGKDLLNTLEAEYFTLETKNLNTIKQAITQTTEKVEDSVLISLGVSVIIENVLYVFLYGQGTIFMKRKDKLGTLLHQDEENNLIGASGFIENGDIVILETPAFSEIVSKDILLPCLEHEKITELADVLSPIIHEKQEGAAAALAFSYREGDLPTTEETKQEEKSFSEELPEEEKEQEPEKLTKDNFEEQEETEMMQKEEKKSYETTQEKEDIFSPMPKVPNMRLSHSKRLFLTIAVIVALVLGASIYFSIAHQKDAEQKALYQSTVIPAQKKYDEGKSLLDLNQNLAKTDFQDAKNMLDGIKGKLSSSSTEGKAYADLVAKVNKAIEEAANANTASAKEVDSASSSLLAALANHSDETYVSADDTNIYLANDKGVLAVNQKTGKEKTVLTNKSDWKSLGGFGAYLNNYYVLDKQDGITKYANGSQTSKTSYFSTATPDLTTATDMAIDGSIWILFSDGNITKYTRGKQDSFTLSGLDKPFSHPSRFATGLDMNNLYILDTGNKRVVVIDKNGKYVAQYQSGIVAQATALDVSEKNKKIFLLANGKIYEIDLK